MAWNAEQKRADRLENPEKYKGKSGPSGKKPPVCPPFITIDGEAILCGWTLKTDKNGMPTMPENVPKRLAVRFPVFFAALSRLLSSIMPARGITGQVQENATVISHAVYNAGLPKIAEARIHPAAILVAPGEVYLRNNSEVLSLLGEELTHDCLALISQEDHCYCLLASDTGEAIGKPGVVLSSTDCLRFLLALKEKHGKAIYCGFSLGYDCEHWIRDFGPSLWQQFRDHSEGDIVLDGKEYTIAYVPRKWFKIRFQGSNEFQNIISVWDTFSFFQSSFVNAVGGPATGQEDGWGAATLEEMEMFIKWKALRGQFACEDWEEVKEYNQMECRALVRLMGKLREAFLGIQVNLSEWHGPGTVAKALLKRYNMVERITSPPPEVEDAIARSYFGGRFEVFEFGQIENVYDYDISSAYPAATSLLPSSDGEWQRVAGYQGDENLWTLYLCSWNVETDLRPFPWRDTDGRIHYPSYGRGWYWGWEVAVARRGWGDAIRIEDGWRLYPLEEGVFSWIVDLAEQRVQAKQAAKDAIGEEKERLSGIARAYKLALNSVYGVLIQTVGKRKSKYLCPMWAALITANTRSKLLAAALSDPEHIVCFATDGLFTNAENTAIVTGKNLGDWELKSKGLHLELYQSGCYSIWKDGELSCAKFRGVAQDAIDWQVIRDEWAKSGGLGSVEMPTKRFYGHRTALARNKPELQCTWVSDKKDVDLKPGTGFFRDLGGDLGQPSMGWSAMFPGVDYEAVSTRYKKLKPGETEAELEEQEVQP